MVLPHTDLARQPLYNYMESHIILIGNIYQKYFLTHQLKEIILKLKSHDKIYFLVTILQTAKEVMFLYIKKSIIY